MERLLRTPITSRKYGTASAMMQMVTSTKARSARRSGNEESAFFKGPVSIFKHPVRRDGEGISYEAEDRVCQEREGSQDVTAHDDAADLANELNI